MTGPVPALAERASAAAQRLHDAESVLLASHIDADGLTSAAIASSSLARAGLDHDVVFEDQLDDEAIRRLATAAEDVLYLTDFGSGQLDAIYEHAADVPTVIADHHQPAAAEDVPADAPTVERADGPDYADAPCHVNPLLVGLDGASELSGAGAAYCVARALAAVVEETATAVPDAATVTAAGTPPAAGNSSADVESAAGNSSAADAETAAETPRAGSTNDASPTDATDPADGTPTADNRDLAALAVVGAVGDMQTEDGELVGANTAIAAEGVDVGVLESGTDLALFGTQTRPLPKLFAYAGELQLPGITNDRNGAARFLDDLDVGLRIDGEWRRWVDLTMDERRTVVGALVEHAVSRGVPPERIDRLVGTTYTLVREAPGTELRDASEFSTLLNATARYDRADVGLAVCLGDRDGALEAARDLLAEHRRNLSRGVDWIAEHGVTREQHCQWIDVGDAIRPTILGIVAGMALGNDGIDRSTPIVAFADDGEDERKVSARATHALVARGVDLSAAMHRAASAVDGGGGGHTVAAGATIPRGRERAFVELVDDVLAEQLEG